MNRGEGGINLSQSASCNIGRMRGSRLCRSPVLSLLRNDGIADRGKPSTESLRFARLKERRCVCLCKI